MLYEVITKEFMYPCYSLPCDGELGVIRVLEDITALCNPSYINTKRPNDVVNVTIIRNEEEKIIPVTLTKKELITYEAKGIEFEDISSTDKKEYGINYGVKIKKITNEDIIDYANRNNFV